MEGAAACSARSVGLNVYEKVWACVCAGCRRLYERDQVGYECARAGGKHYIRTLSTYCQQFFLNYHKLIAFSINTQ